MTTAVDARAAPPRRRRSVFPLRRGRRPLWLAVVVVVFALAFFARLMILLRGAGITGMGAYDDGVYYASAVMLVHGHLPYRDFLFLQPPAITLLLTPFAWFATLVGDPVAFGTARVVFQLVGAVNAVLVAVALRRSGVVAGVVGGAFYAAFFPAVYDERTLLIEPFATLGILVALVLRDGARSATRGSRIVAGVGLGLALSLKIWYVVPAAIIVVAWRRGRVLVAAVAALVLVVITAPFIALAPRTAFREIISDQLGRPRSIDSGTSKRLETILGVIGLRRQPALPHIPLRTQLLIVAILVLAALVVALIDRRGRLFGVLLAATGAVLIAAPSFYQHYAALTAAPIALVLGVAAGRLAGTPRLGPRTLAVIAVFGLFTIALNIRHDHEKVDRATPAAALLRASPSFPRCVMADDPTILATMDRLTSQVAAGCPLWPDVTGWTYDHDDYRIDGKPVQRVDNPLWQRDVFRYLESGDALILVRGGTGLSPTTHHALSTGRELFRDGTYVVHLTEK